VSVQNEIDQKRQKTIASVLIFLIPLLGALAYVRYQEQGTGFQAMFDTALMLGAIFSLIMIRSFPTIHQTVTRVILFVATGAFLLTLYNQRGAPEILIWGITIILLSFLLRGRHGGWFWSLLTIAGTLVLTLLAPAYLTGLDAFTMITFIGNAFLIALFASWYEYLSETEIRRIQSEQKRLESLVRYRTRSLHEANAQAMKALKKAQDASKAKSTFLANVSHEIRTPLNAINGFITMMMKDESDPVKKKQLQTIHEASDILTQLISDILDLSKIESGNMELNYSEFDPRQLFFSVAELYQSRALEKRIDLRIEFCHGGEDVRLLYSDPMRIRQVLNNLLSNAVKFTNKDGKILVSGCYRDGWLTFTVEDNGIGMTPADQERIFQPFQQAHNPDGNIQGTGLGLTISREIAERLQGRLEVRSAPGIGSTFTFTIPARRVSNRKSVPTAPQKKIPDKIDAHLLVVEDVRANQMFITMVLDRHAISYDIANDGVEAVEMFREKRYDLILMDENMPRMNGIEATAEIRAIERQEKREPIPIIALTANAVAGDRERLLKAGMDEYISKPVNPDTLIRSIATLLDRW
jgi:signal transduction histidine kinase/ActR/RegA family two-component response regulator